MLYSFLVVFSSESSSIVSRKSEKSTPIKDSRFARGRNNNRRGRGGKDTPGKGRGANKIPLQEGGGKALKRKGKK